METSVPTPTILSGDAIRSLPVERLGDLDGVTHRVLWRDEDAMAGVLTVEAGRHLGEHQHRANHHHMWVLEGSAIVLGSLVEPGAYLHIPSGVLHDIDATGTAGCTVFYLYLRP